MAFRNPDDISVGYRDFPGVDAFGHLRVSIPEARVAILSQYDTEPLHMEKGATGTGVTPTHQVHNRMTRLSATAGTGESFLQTWNYWSYQPGRSQRVELTGKFSTPVAGATVDFGYFDAANGLFYRQNGTFGVQMVRRSSCTGSTVNTAINQVDWNLDKLDGTGPSGKVLDPSKVFILTLDFEFLGMGRVRIGFNIDGDIIYTHEFLHANIETLPYMQTATLPLHIVLTATSTAATSETFFKGAIVMSEGGVLKDLGFAFATPDANIITTVGVRNHLLSIRPRMLFNGLTNRQAYLTTSLELLVTDKDPVFWELVVGANFSVNPIFADINPVFSGTEYGTNGTFTGLFGGPLGAVLAAGYVGTNASESLVHIPITHLQHSLTLNRAGLNTAMGTHSILVTGIGSPSSIHACINFTELR